jgi:uncharacterized protein YcnI
MSPVRPSLRSRVAAIALGGCAAALLVIPALAYGHAVVYPRTSTSGGREKYVLRVPNEKAVATTRVEIRFPADMKVSAFEDVAGWQLEVLTDSAKRIIGAVWTGTLAPQRFVEFPFVAANPATGMQVAWPTYQTYADGMRVEWTGAPGSKSPASVTTISAPVQSGGLKSVTPYVSWVALVLSVISLGLALRPRTNS